MSNKINIVFFTNASANVMPISTFRTLHRAMFDANENALDKFSKGWTTLRAYGGGIIKQFWDKNDKM